MTTLTQQAESLRRFVTTYVSKAPGDADPEVRRADLTLVNLLCRVARVVDAMQPSSGPTLENILTGEQDRREQELEELAERLFVQMIGHRSGWLAASADTRKRWRDLAVTAIEWGESRLAYGSGGTK